MKVLIRLYRFFNILSLDVAVGSVISAAFFARIFHAPILPQGLIALGVTVWIIYTADHLVDVQKMQQIASTKRHQFHQKHFKVLIVMTLVVFFVDMVEICFINKVLIVEGLWLSIVVAIYFLVQQRLGFLKELVGALLYTSGILLIPFSVKIVLSPIAIVLILQFVLTALINLLLFSWMDHSHDEMDRHRSLPTTFGKKTASNILVFLFVTQALLLITSMFLFTINKAPLLILFLMNVFLLLIFLRKNFFEKEDRYRLLGDAVFLLPLLYFLF